MTTPSRAELLARADPDLRAFASMGPPDGADLSDAASVRRLTAVLMPAPPVAPGVTASDIAVDGRPGDPPVVARVLAPDGHGPGDRRAVLLWCHGGGYISGDHHQDDDRLSAWVLALDCVAVSVGYRLAPDDPYPAALDDATAVLSWLAGGAGALAGGAGALGIDPARVVLGGVSAGGGLAAALGLRAAPLGIAVGHQLLCCPMLDDTTSTTSSRWPAPLWHRGANEWAWRHYLGDLAGRDVPATAAPARADAATLATSPATMLVVGTVDALVDEGIDYARRLVHAGVATELLVAPGGVHGFDAPALAGADVSRRAQAAELAFLRRATAPSPG